LRVCIGARERNWMGAEGARQDRRARMEMGDLRGMRLGTHGVGLNSRPQRENGSEVRLRDTMVRPR
jgi:hypothetical protein